MANNFTSYVSKSVGTSAATLVTVAAATQTTVIGMTVANTTASAITCDVYFTRSAVDYYLIKSATVQPGTAFIPVGGDQKLVLTTGDALKVVTNTASSADVIASVLNIT